MFIFANIPEGNGGLEIMLVEYVSTRNALQKIIVSKQLW